ncbi:VOC family protein [Fodinicola acaciae]|uniref:VOC family protein n=1 Tax=Fodinicola acaciae TaxID=2681555 RepID=UPI0013D1E464|nr:VOC family protein [Fodinicola acaciae]
MPPRLRQVVLDTTDPRALAEFYRQLLGFHLRPGDGDDWAVLLDDDGQPRLAFQQVPELAPTTWPEPGIAQQMHLDLTVPSKAELDAQHERALALGARLRDDQSDDEEEPLRVYADPSGHLFCIFVVAPLSTPG